MSRFKHNSWVVAVLGVSLTFCNNAMAGLSAGAEIDYNGTSVRYVGLQTEDPLFVSLYVSEIDYSYLDGQTTVKVNSLISSPAIGYRFSGPLAFSIAAGVNVTNERKTQDNVRTRDSKRGAVVQAGLSYSHVRNDYELLMSYDDTTRFLWSRARVKHRYRNRIYMGAEVFWLGNNDYQSQGIAALLEIKGDHMSALVKAGVSRSRDGGHGGYGGIELSIPF